MDLHPYNHLLKTFALNDAEYTYFDVKMLSPAQYDTLPYCIRVLLETSVRNCNFQNIRRKDVSTLLNWPGETFNPTTTSPSEDNTIPFFPARLVFQDFTAIPSLIDLACMREYATTLGVDPLKVQPLCPMDLLLDRCFQLPVENAVKSRKNEELEFLRCEERLAFIKWAQNAFKNIGVVPPGTGVIHQVNMQYMARVVYNSSNLLYPDSLLGVDSHASLVNGMGVLGWSIGGMAAESLVFGKAASIPFPCVIGYEIVGLPDPLATSTDCVLAIAKNLTLHNLKGCIVEFLGPGVSLLSIPERCTIAHMCPEYGALAGFFAVDERCIQFLKATGRDPKSIMYTQEILRRMSLFRDYETTEETPKYSRLLTMDLSSVTVSCSGPRRPMDRTPVNSLKEYFESCVSGPEGPLGYGLTPDKLDLIAEWNMNGTQHRLKHGCVLMASINSCTNTSNPAVMLAAGLLAENAVKMGLKTSPFVSTSFLPGPGTARYYLKESGVIPYLEELGFTATDCLSASEESFKPKCSALSVVADKGIISCGLLSGNRNFDDRISPLIGAHFLMSPPLIVAFAIAGTVAIDFDKDPVGTDVGGNPVFLRDVWPTRQQVQQVEEHKVLPSMFSETSARVFSGGERYSKICIPSDIFYPWNPESTFLQRPPFFTCFTKLAPPLCGINNAYCLVYFGNSVSTDHISPAGSISRNSPAAVYLSSCGLCPRDFHSYGARRGNCNLMACGTFSHLRLTNYLVKRIGPYTLHLPSRRVMEIYNCAQLYMAEAIPLIVLAGKDFGCGASRDWAAKGPWLLGVRAIIAESYDPVYRSELIEAGILPLAFCAGESAASLRLTGKERFTIEIPHFMHPRQILRVSMSDWRVFQVQMCVYNDMECVYYQNGGVLSHRLRSILSSP